jgi:hypothetical protein
MAFFLEEHLSHSYKSVSSRLLNPLTFHTKEFGQRRIQTAPRLNQFKKGLMDNGHILAARALRHVGKLASK